MAKARIYFSSAPWEVIEFDLKCNWHCPKRIYVSTFSSKFDDIATTLENVTTP
jgi:hypothetical protein